MVPLVYHVKPSKFHQLPGQEIRTTSMAKQIGYEKQAFGQFMIAAVPRHLLFKEVLHDMFGKLMSWKDTSSTRKIALAARICWLTGPYAFTVVLERLVSQNKFNLVPKFSGNPNDVVVFKDDFANYVIRKNTKNYGRRSDYYFLKTSFFYNSTQIIYN